MLCKTRPIGLELKWKLGGVRQEGRIWEFFFFFLTNLVIQGFQLLWTGSLWFYSMKQSSFVWRFIKSSFLFIFRSLGIIFSRMPLSLLLEAIWDKRIPREFLFLEQLWVSVRERLQAKGCSLIIVLSLKRSSSKLFSQRFSCQSKYRGQFLFRLFSKPCRECTLEGNL